MITVMCNSNKLKKNQPCLCNSYTVGMGMHLDHVFFFLLMITKQLPVEINMT